MNTSHDGDHAAAKNTAGPDSVHESVFESADDAGKAGPNASDPPAAADGVRSADPNHDGVVGAEPDGEVDPELGTDLDPDESADLMESRRDARRIKQSREDRDDDTEVTLDPPD